MVRPLPAMLVSTTPHSAIRELDHRMNDGLDVWLLWNSRTNQVFVAVEDPRSGDLFEVTVSGADALDAFHNPHVYCADGRAPNHQ